jgi:Zn-finger nucleic acid-binding protein
MKTCPVCTTTLMTADRQGIEIDHCPRCRGVWLDRGELEKVIERSAQYAGYDRGEDDDSDWGDDRRRSGGRMPPQPGYHQGGYPPPGQHPPRKMEGFFGRLFDFD